jgi:hypothetical protein
VLSFKVIITLMCRGHLEDKYRCKWVHFFLDSLLHEPLFSVKLGGPERRLFQEFSFPVGPVSWSDFFGRIVSIVPLIDSAPPSSFSFCYGVDSIDWPESL